MRDTIQLLEAWGRWSRDQCLPQGYICGLAVVMAQNVGGVVSIAPVNEDDMRLIEPVMRTLKQRKPEHYSVLYLSYVHNMSTRKIGKHLDRSNGWASDMLKAAEAWVDGAMASSIFIA